MKILHRFVTNIPKEIENGTIYISMEYATAIHKCLCGCGNEVVTPFSPMDWSLSFNGETISLDPSIYNTNYKCQSHYWIVNDEVKWVPKLGGPVAFDKLSNKKSESNKKIRSLLSWLFKK